MSIDYDSLMQWRPEDVTHRYTSRDAMLYALGIGLSSDPLDERELRYTYEKDLLVLPTFAVTLGNPKTWWRETGQIDVTQVVHGEQGLRIHKTPAPEGEVIGSTRIVDIIDKGEGRGALLYTERTVTDAVSGELIATATSTSFARGNGGFGGPSGPVKPVHEIPTRAPDCVLDMPTLPRAALIYRLSGDYNPLHADPAIGTAAGFRQPILHGLCSYGIAGWAITTRLCDNDPSRVVAMDTRFSSPVYPGETIRVELWTDGRVASFRARVLERDVMVLNNGRAELR
jgi:acyl dehydratase